MLAHGSVPRTHKKRRARGRGDGGGSQKAPPAPEADTPPCVPRSSPTHDREPLGCDVEEFLQGPSLVSWLHGCLAEEPNSLLADEASVLAAIQEEEEFLTAVFVGPPPSPPPLF